MSINFINPYCSDKQLASHYNTQAARFNDDEWVCFVDADAMFLASDFGQQLEEIIDEHGEKYLAFTCMTNRVGNLRQCYGGKISNDFDLIHHVKVSEKLQTTARTDVVKMKAVHIMSGVLILAKVSTIKEIPFRGKGMLGVDNNFHLDIAKKGVLGLMKGVYVFHKYRAGQGIRDTKHLR